MTPSAAPTARLAHGDGRTMELAREHDFEPLEVSGALPAELRGTLVRNGPGLRGLFGRPYSHVFESDGLITAVRLDGAGGALGASKLVQSAGLLEERAAKRMRFGQNVGWLRRLWNFWRSRVKNTANTNVVMWQGRLFALMEAAPPTELDPEDLSTLGERDLDGAVVSAFAAHPHDVPARDALYNFGLSYGRKTRLELYELPRAGAARHMASLPLPFAPMLHDFVATERYLVFFVSPVVLQVRSLMLGVGSFEEIFQWEPERGCEIIVVPIDEPTAPRRFCVDPFYQWHFANAFQSGRGDEIVIDFVRYANFDSLAQLNSTDIDGVEAGTLSRARLDPNARTLEVEPLADALDGEFPRVHPARAGAEHDAVWLIQDARDDRRIDRVGVADGTRDTYAFPEHEHPSELVIAPCEGRDYGLTLVYDERSHRSHLAVFDAYALAAGPMARAAFRQYIPYTFHGCWAPS